MKLYNIYSDIWSLYQMKNSDVMQPRHLEPPRSENVSFIQPFRSAGCCDNHRLYLKKKKKKLTNPVSFWGQQGNAVLVNPVNPKMGKWREWAPRRAMMLTIILIESINFISDVTMETTFKTNDVRVQIKSSLLWIFLPVWNDMMLSLFI